MYCKKCGALIKDGAKFCSHCGCPVTQAEQISVPRNEKTENLPVLDNVQQPAGQDSSHDAETPKKQSLLGMIVGGIIVVALIFGWAAGKVAIKSSIRSFLREDLGLEQYIDDFTHRERPARTTAKEKPHDVGERTNSQAREARQNTERREPKPANQPSDTFVHYHQLITDHKYQEAYQCFTPSMQESMGDYETWAQGYATTVSSIPEQVSVISNDGTDAVLSFYLKATDLINGRNQVQYFKGQCRLTKIDGQWKIAEISAQLG